MEVKFYGPTRLNRRHVAYKLAERNNIHHLFQEGACWQSLAVYLFLKRHEELFVHKPTETFFLYIVCFNDDDNTSLISNI
jgi:hypothetical protein